MPITLSACRGSGAQAHGATTGAGCPGPITSAVVDSGGGGYAILGRAAPELTIAGTGAGATFTPSFIKTNRPCGDDTWGITSVAVSGGTGYTGGETLSITPQTGSMVTEAATLVLRTAAPTVTASASGGSGAVLAVTLTASAGHPAGEAPYVVQSVSVTDGGTGYTDGAAVTFAASGARLATSAAATIHTGTDTGRVNPELTPYVWGFDGTTAGTGAVLSATMSYVADSDAWEVASVSIIDGGSGYQVDEYLWYSQLGSGGGTVFDNPPYYAPVLDDWHITAVDENGAITALDAPGGFGLYYKNATVNNGRIASVTVTNGGQYDSGVPSSVAVVGRYYPYWSPEGSGRAYKDDPSATPYVASVTASVGGVGFGAVMSAQVDGSPSSPTFGTVTSITVVNSGYNYSKAGICGTWKNPCLGCCCTENPYYYNPIPYASDAGTCARLGGTFYTGKSCDSFSCPPPKSACCVDGECKGPMESAECSALGGIWNQDPYSGNLLDCTFGGGCGCCCHSYSPYGTPDPFVYSEWQCSWFGGTWYPNQKCSTLSCPQPGACCYNGTCTLTMESDCKGRWVGAGTNCDDIGASCPEFGACCYNGICSITTEQECLGTWKGSGTTDCVDLRGDFSVSLSGCQQISSIATATNTLGVPALLEASGGADDEVLIDGSVYEPGKYGFYWDYYGQPCGSKTGDNGGHNWSYSRVLAPGESVTFGGKDNGYGGGVSGSWTISSCFEPRGSCCFGDGTCQEKSQTQCAQLGGAWQAGGACTPNPCPQPGACCHENGSCDPGVLQSNCSGSWGEGASCDGCVILGYRCDPSAPNVSTKCPPVYGISGSAAPSLYPDEALCNSQCAEYYECAGGQCQNKYSESGLPAGAYPDPLSCHDRCVMGKCCYAGTCSQTYKADCLGSWEEGASCPTCPNIDSECKCICDQGYEECGGNCVWICDTSVACGPILGQTTGGPGYTCICSPRNPDCSCNCRWFPNGACCAPDGSCTITTQAGCTGGSNWQSQKTCEQVSCNGGCCYGDSCSLTTKDACDQGGGIWKGYGPDCGTQGCRTQNTACWGRGSDAKGAQGCSQIYPWMYSYQTCEDVSSNTFSSLQDCCTGWAGGNCPTNCQSDGDCSGVPCCSGVCTADIYARICFSCQSGTCEKIAICPPTTCADVSAFNFLSDCQASCF